MEPRPNFHPVYVSGQYLTSEHLNETQNFLWQDEKATRYAICGNGIAKGMEADFSGTTLLEKLMLNAGAASTIDGYLVMASSIAFDRGVGIDLMFYTTADNTQQLLDKTSFDKLQSSLSVATSKKITATELIADSVKEADLPDGAKTLSTFSITTAQALANYILIAWVDIEDAENNHCQQGDCNTKGIQRNYVTRYFLVNNSDFPKLNSQSNSLHTCSVKRIKNLSLAGSETGMYQNSFNTWSTSLADLNPYFNSATTTDGLGAIASLLGTDQQAAFTNAAAKFKSFDDHFQKREQYYVLFASDLSQAINELVNYYDEYILRYPTLGGPRIERTIVVGALRNAAAIDAWRYYFISAPLDVKWKSDKRKLERLFYRVLAMVNCFIPQANIITQAAKVNKTIAAPTNIGESLLQNCAIPYYYDITLNGNNNELLMYWNPQGDCNNIFCYYDSVVPARTSVGAKLTNADWYHYNFFRIEGHVGMLKPAAISAITNLIVNEGLPIQLIDCDVNYKGPQKWTEWYDDFKVQLADWVKNLRKDYKEYDFDPLKKVQDRLEQTSYRNMAEVTRILNDFNAYSNVLYNPKAHPTAPAPGGGVVTAPAKSTGIPIDAYAKYKTIVTPEKTKNIIDKYKQAAAEQNDLQAQKLITLKDLVDLEYLGGAPRGGTFVLLHNGNKVVGDGCLSYYYRINQGRIFSPAK